MIEKLIKKGFGVALWTVEKSLYVKIQFKTRQQRAEYPIDTNIQHAVAATAIKLANNFPHLIDPDELRKMS